MTSYELSIEAGHLQEHQIIAFQRGMNQAVAAFVKSDLSLEIVNQVGSDQFGSPLFDQDSQLANYAASYRGMTEDGGFLFAEIEDARAFKAEIEYINKTTDMPRVSVAVHEVN